MSATPVIPSHVWKITKIDGFTCPVDHPKLTQMTVHGLVHTIDWTEIDVVPRNCSCYSKGQPAHCMQEFDMVGKPPPVGTQLKEEQTPVIKEKAFVRAGWAKGVRVYAYDYDTCRESFLDKTF